MALGTFDPLLFQELVGMHIEVEVSLQLRENETFFGSLYSLLLWLLGGESGAHWTPPILCLKISYTST